MQKQIIAITLSAFMFLGGVGGSTIETSYVSNAASKSKVVYIAPYSGKKYHAHKKCRGLRKARTIEPIKIKIAKSKGYTACKLCY